ncbi:MAG: tryptophan synthase subunit beta [Bacteroidales bacterium]|nr:tryptophan synthase subunit beta [Bacteroidales bacterium]
MEKLLNEKKMPNERGFFGEFGGSFIPEQLTFVMKEITDKYDEIKDTEEFKRELMYLNKHYTGRPSPVFYAKNLSEKIGGAKIFLKREDLNHTGAHKINHCLGEALLAKKMGKKKLIAETGAGQHGVALATAAALVGLECDIYMGEVDIEKEYPNVVKMKILGAKVIPVTHGLKTLKEAVDSAFEAYLKDTSSQIYAIGSIVGPHPFPMMVRDFQKIVGIEAKEQFLQLTGILPNNLVACVGGGSNAMGLFSAFLNDESVNMYGVEPNGKGNLIGEHAATLTYGEPGILHGFKSQLLKDNDGNPAPVHTVASGLDYPGVGPQHSYLKKIKRVKYTTIYDNEAIDAFFELSRCEGIIPAIESAHAVAYAMKLAAKMNSGNTILVNLSGRGDKDIDYIVKTYPENFILND